MIAFTLMDSAPAFIGFDVARDGSIGYTRGGMLLVRRPGDTVAFALKGVAGGSGTPVFSPDGSDLVVSTRAPGQAGTSTIVRVPAAGGVATPLFSSAIAGPLAWSKDGWIYALNLPSQNLDSAAIVRVGQTGGEHQIVARGFFAGVALLPGERALIACAMDLSTRQVRLIAVDIASGDTSHVADAACSPTWSPTGHILASRGDGTIRAIPFDPVALRVTGDPILLLDDVATTLDGTASYRLTPDGTLLYLRGKVSAALTREYTLITLDGRRRALPITPGALGRAAFSPNGGTIAYARDGGLWTWDLNLGTNRRVSAGIANDVVWSPDGMRVAYTGGTALRLVVRGLGSDTGEATIGASTGFESPKQWLRDGGILASRSGPSGADIVMFRADSAGKSRVILGADWDEDYPQVSHDGRWIAYISRELGWYQLTVRTWPSLERKVVLADSVAPGTLRWSPDDKTLYYKKGLKLMAASLAAGESLRAVSHRVIADSVNVFDDLHPDGQRLLVRRDVTAPGESRRSLVGITGWLSELRRKVAAATGAR